MQAVQTEFPGLTVIYQTLDLAQRRKLTEADAAFLEAALHQCCANYPSGCWRVAECLEQHSQVAGYLPGPSVKAQTMPAAKSRYCGWVQSVSMKELVKIRRAYSESDS